MTKTFAAQMADFRDRTNGRMRTVLSSSVQEVVEEAQRPVSSGGRMPVDTRFLRNSLVSELNGTEVAQGGYGEATGQLSTPWEFKTVRQMSEKYISGLIEGRNLLSIPPAMRD